MQFAKSWTKLVESEKNKANCNDLLLFRWRLREGWIKKPILMNANALS